jgi:hypothetical protein
VEVRVFSTAPKHSETPFFCHSRVSGNPGPTHVTHMQYPEIVDYPDSGKFGAMEFQGTGADGRPRGARFLGRRETSVDYWDGE